MNKEFIPYEEALALKELGFDEVCFSFYINEKDLARMGKYYRVNETNEYPCGAPLYQQAFRWFREEYNQHCLVTYHSKPEYSIIVYNDLRAYKSIDELLTYESYEEAELACLRQLIKMIRDGE